MDNGSVIPDSDIVLAPANPDLEVVILDEELLDLREFSRCLRASWEKERTIIFEDLVFTLRYTIYLSSLEGIDAGKESLPPRDRICSNKGTATT